MKSTDRIFSLLVVVSIIISAGTGCRTKKVDDGRYSFAAALSDDEGKTWK